MIDGPPVLVVGDEDVAREATIAQMQRTANRFTRGVGPALPSTPQPLDSGFVGRPDRVFVLPIDQMAAPVPPVNGFAPSANFVSLVPTDSFLLLTSSSRGAKAVRMQGSTPTESWPMTNEAANSAGLLLQAFGVRVVDLRDTAETQEDPHADATA